MNILHFLLSNIIENKYGNYNNDSKVILHILKASTIKYLHAFYLYDG